MLYRVEALAARRFPQGSVPTDKMRALLLCAERERGVGASDAILVAAGLPKSLVESAPSIGLESYAQALTSYNVDAPKGFELTLARTLLEAPFCARFAALLRRAGSPVEVLDQGGLAFDEPTMRWETTTSQPGRWTGRVVFAHDPTLERSGQLERVRMQELRLVPELFGFTQCAAHAFGDGRYALTWHAPNRSRTAALSGFFVSIAVLSEAFVFSITQLPGATHPWMMRMLATLPLWLAVGVAVRFGLAQRDIATRAQSLKLRIFEALLEQRDAAADHRVGDFEGALVAGIYRVGTRLGTGANGVVYEAVRLADDRPVALKLLRAAAAHDVTASDRLRREAEALGLAWHPHVVEVLDHGKLPDGTAYMALERLSGETLARRLTRQGHLSESDSVKVATQLAEALSAMHAAGVIHRDIKPENVYLAHHQSGEIFVKILDFGIAKVEWEEMRITNHDAPLGTPGYMAPEQERGEELDARADLYALGVVLFECLIGRLPPESELGASGADPVKSALDDALVSVQHAGLRLLVRKLLEENRESRPASSRLVALELKRIGPQLPPSSLSAVRSS